MAEQHEQEDAMPRRSEREKMSTAKGREYNLSVLKKNLDGFLRNMEIRENKVEQYLVESNTKYVDAEYRTWLCLREDYLETYVRYCEYLDEEEKRIYFTEIYDPKIKEMQIFNARISCWLEKHTTLKPPASTAAASACSSKYSTGTQKTKSSRRSKASTAKTASRLIELNAELIADKKEDEVDEAYHILKQRELKLQQEQLEIEKQKILLKRERKTISIQKKIAVLEAKSETGSIKNAQFFGCQSQMSASEKCKQYLNPESPTFFQKIDTQPLNRVNEIKQEEDFFCTMISQMKKPNTDIKKFSGSPLEYKKFMRQFDMKIMQITKDLNERMNYLEYYTTGEAHRIVSGYSHLEGEEGFPAAIKELEERYGDTDVIAQSFIKKALDWPDVRPNDAKSFDDFSIFLVECENAVRSIESMKTLEYPDNLKRLVAKLPYFMHDRWRNLVQQRKETGLHAQFHDLVDLVRKEAKRINDPIYGKDAIVDVKKRSPKSVVTGKQVNTVYGATQPPKNNRRKCLYCKDVTHWLEKCEKFEIIENKEKSEFCKRLGVCFACLRPGHKSADCKHKLKCDKPDCGQFHPTVMHRKIQRFANANHGGNGEQSPHSQDEIEERKNSRINTNGNNSLDEERPTVPEKDSHTAQHPGDVSTCMSIIPVRVGVKDSATVLETYAFLDTGSNISMCSESLMRKLGAKGQFLPLTLNTMGEKQKLKTFAVRNFQIGDLEGHNLIDLPTVYTKDKMPVSKSSMPQQSDLEKWEHLKHIKFTKIEGDVEILIGNNVPDAYTPIDVSTGPRGSPHATKTLLGWVPWNITRVHAERERHSNFVDAQLITECHNLKELDYLVRNAMGIDFPEKRIHDKKEDSLEDKLFKRKVNGSIHLHEGHYMIDMPFRDEEVQFPDNRVMALQRLQSLKNKLRKNDKFMDDYMKFMTTIIDRGFAESVPEANLDRKDDKVWYIPHHGVYHAKKGKLRVVFDCTAQFNGVAINDLLLPGPDLINNLVGVLLRFRQGYHAIMGDIEKMFYMVRVPEKDRDVLRFYWWTDGNMENDPQEYRMTVHLFGAVSSPSCSNMALRQTAIDFGDMYDDDIIKCVNKCFYVDDFLKSDDTIYDSTRHMEDVTSICARGGFRVTGWIATNEDVLKAIPESERAEPSKAKERALGVAWYLDSDSFGFNMSAMEAPFTRRGILSMVSSVYDPLGLIAPYILPGRIILQELCNQELEWDAPITVPTIDKWREWKNSIMKAKDFKVPRCIKPQGFEYVVSYQLHHFSDASEKGYGTASYLRIVNSDGLTHCTLLMGKSRVAPLKKVTIPRLELTAATLMVKVDAVLRRELDIVPEETYFWTDSMSVLRYIRNKVTRFKTFVANRVSFIQESTTLLQWRHISGSLNPADMASRGIVSDVMIPEWFNGPKFLLLEKSQWYKEDDIPVIEPATDDEIRMPKVSTVIASKDNDVVKTLLIHCSTWNKLRKLIGRLVLVRRFLRRRAKEGGGISPSSKKNIPNTIVLDEEAISEAELLIIQCAQRECFAEEIEALRTNKPLSKTSPLFKLDPFLDENDLLRIGGRIDLAIISYNEKHPIAMPNNCTISEILVRHIHQHEVGHLGKDIIIHKLREKYWLVGAIRMVKRIIVPCVICRKYQRRAQRQKMADLPRDRLAIEEPPFSRTGVDYFGPFVVKRGRITVKRYGVLFTCMTTRAIHLESAFSLNTDSCIHAIRRFIARRGNVKTMWSDNGTNFVAANKELKAEFKNINHDSITEEFSQKGISWKFNPPSGSHFGGIWERMIRTVRKVLHSILKQQLLRIDDESFSTLLCEVEAIVNSRPLTRVSNDPNDLRSITPNSLLLLRNNGTMPPGVFNSSDNYTRKRWKRVQYLSDLFWKRWVKEYIPLLQGRSKWLDNVKNVSVNDIVLIVDDAPRNSWSLGKIIKVLPDKHGKVRVCEVKTKNSVVRRPVHKLVSVLEFDD